MSAANGIKARLAAALVAVIIAMPQTPHAQDLGQPASVDLGFLTVLGEEASWLDGELSERGMAGRYEITGDRLVTDDLPTLKYVNRIRAFADLDRPRIHSWYSLHLVDTEDREIQCVTLYPRDFLPEFSVLDFRRERFEVPDTSSADFDGCRVPKQIRGDYADAGREEFRTRYFGEFGELKMNEFSRFSTDPAFIAKAIDLGFHATKGSFSGYLQISLDEPVS